MYGLLCRCAVWASVQVKVRSVRVWVTLQVVSMQVEVKSMRVQVTLQVCSVG